MCRGCGRKAPLKYGLCMDCRMMPRRQRTRFNLDWRLYDQSCDYLRVPLEDAANGCHEHREKEAT